VLLVDAADNQTILHENVDPREEKINFGVSLRRIRHQEAEIHAEPYLGDFAPFGHDDTTTDKPPCSVLSSWKKLLQVLFLLVGK